METDYKLPNGQHHSNGLSTNTNLKDRFKEICRTKNGFELDNELVKIAKEWQISLQDCRFLWENYCQLDKKISPFQQWRQATWKRITQLSGTLVTISHFSIAIGMIAFIISAENREDKTTEDTWKLITSVGIEAGTNSGRIDALQLLNQGCKPFYSSLGIMNNIPILRGFFPDCIDLVGLDVSNANLNKIDLQHGKLAQAKFEKAELEDANFSDAKLQASNFNEAILNRAVFHHTNLEDAKLVGASLINAQLKDANLYQADLSYADLRGADLRGTNLLDADTEGASFKGAIVDSKTQPSNLKGVYFIDQEQKTKLDLRQKNLQGIILSNANLENVNLIGVNLQKADLSGANFKNANLTGANLYEANLNGANLENANLAQTNLRGANLNGIIYNKKTTFAEAIYDDRTVRSPSINWLLMYGINKVKAYKIKDNANLNNAILSYANLRHANLSHAKLKNAWLRRADLRGVDLREADLEGAILTSALYDITTKLPEKFRKVFETKAYKIDAGSVLNKAKLARQNLEDANLAWAKLETANLNGTNLNGAKLEGANLIDAELNDATLINANLQYADLRGADLTDADLKDADLIEADLTKTKGLKTDQVQQAKNWQKAKYDPEFAKKLGL